MHIDTSTHPAFCRAFSKAPVTDTLLALCSTVTLFSLARTNRIANNAVRQFIESSYSVNSCLKHFVDDPVAFRVMIAKAFAVIGGDIPFEFFNRSIKRTNRLEIFVGGIESGALVCRWLVDHGYQFRPCGMQTEYDTLESSLHATAESWVKNSLIMAENTIDANASDTLRQTFTRGEVENDHYTTFDFEKYNEEVTSRKRVVKVRNGPRTGIELLLANARSSEKTRNLYSPLSGRSTPWNIHSTAHWKHQCRQQRSF